MPEKMTARKQQAMQMRTRIQKAALDLFDKEGFENVSVEQVAHAVGCSVGNIYHYFKSKDELALQVTDSVDRIYLELEKEYAAEAESTAYDKLMDLKDDITTVAYDESEIRVTYEKSDWVKGNLRPEHYFACVSYGEDGTSLEYNTKYLEGIVEKQDIEYDVGFNQSIRVNSTADECFDHGIGRTVDDLVQAMKDVIDMQKVKSELEALKSQVSEADLPALESKIETVTKAYDMMKDKSQRMFEKSITAMQGYLADANLCITECGTRSSKLSLIKARIQTQKTTFETLKSENEDVDITEVAIHLSSAKLTYEAALMATGKVTQSSLLNYI